MKILNNNNEIKADKELEKKARKILNNNNEIKADKELLKKASKILNNSKEYKTLEQLKEMNKAEKKADKKLEKKAWKDFKKERKLFYKTHSRSRHIASPSLAKLPPSEVLKKKRMNDKNEEPSVIKRLKDALVYLFAIIVVIFYFLAFLGGIFNPESKTQEEFESYQDINEPRGP